MRLSPWHMEVAKRVAEGKKWKELSQEIKISQSRLSVLKANPLFQKQVRKYTEMRDDGYQKAMKEMNRGAEDVAKEVYDIATSKIVPPQVRLQAAKDLLDRVGMSNGTGQTPAHGGQDEISFEQILKITKRRAGGPMELDDEQDYESAQRDLLSDLESVSPQEAA